MQSVYFLWMLILKYVQFILILCRFYMEILLLSLLLLSLFLVTSVIIVQLFVSQAVRTVLLQYHHYLTFEIDDNATSNFLNLSFWDSQDD